MRIFGLILARRASLIRCDGNRDATLLLMYDFYTVVSSLLLLIAFFGLYFIFLFLLDEAVLALLDLLVEHLLEVLVHVVHNAVADHLVQCRTSAPLAFPHALERIVRALKRTVAVFIEVDATSDRLVINHEQLLTLLLVVYKHLLRTARAV